MSKKSIICTYHIDVVTRDGCSHSHHWRCFSFDNAFALVQSFYGSNFDFCYINDGIEIHYFSRSF